MKTYQAALTAIPIIAAAVTFDAAFAGGWQLKTTTDNLDSTKQSEAVYSEAKPFQQNGSPVRSFLSVYCFKSEKRPELTAALQFSSAVAIGKAQFRWRVDEKAIWSKNLLIDGTFLLLSGTMEKDGSMIDSLRDAQMMRVEANLPWAGVVLLDFDVSGAAEAFAKLPCGKTK
jgi:hypothetical protein